MKGEYVEVRKNHSNNITPSNIYMFGKLHQTQNFNHHHHQLPSQPIVSMSAPPPPPPSSSANDGATIEVVRRPRGRPPGSKNKPKPAPNYITTTHDDHMEKSTMRLCILNGSGTVTNVTLTQPFTNNPDSTITFHGNFNILSISATIIPQSIFSKVLNGFSISLAGPQGQVVGGPVIRPLLSAGPVYLIAASFNNSFYHKFSVEDDEGSQSAVAGDGDSGHTLESTHHEYCY
ncbi:AT-hook motif nuclear-localized protein 28-like [Capsicum galapagoense]